MLQFKIKLKAADSIEDHFWDFVDNNELCTVQASCELGSDGQWELEMVPNWDDSKSDFMVLCGQLVDHLEGLEYVF